MAKGPELTEGQRAYEAKRAAKAGMSLEKWLALKEKEAAAERAAAEKAAQAAAKQAGASAAAAAAAGQKKPGFFARLLERAQKPL